MSDKKLRFANQEQVRTLFGTNDRNLKRLREALQINVVLRGDELRITGEPEQVEAGSAMVTELQSIIERRGYLSDEDFDRVLLRGRNGGEASISDVEVFQGKAKRIYPMGAGQQKYVQAMRDNDLVFCTGPAGSGKTYLAVAMAVNALRHDLVRKIVLVRPAVEAGEKLGFLPGDMIEKVNPYLRPLLDAMQDILDVDTVARYLAKEVIEIAPLAFMRGRTLNETFIILDEAQNTTITQMKMLLTRMGQRSQIVVTGDPTQIDLPQHVPSGLTDAIRRLNRVDGIGCVELSGGDIVRHPLVRKIVDAYDERSQQQETPAHGAWPLAEPSRELDPLRPLERPRAVNWMDALAEIDDDLE